MADKRSSLTQIAQSALDIENQSLKVSSVSYKYLSNILLDYVLTPVDTVAWVEITATVGSVPVKRLEVFDSSGEVLQLAIGPSGSESPSIFILPGGNGLVSVDVAAGSRLSVKAVSGTANSGLLVINLYG